MNERALCIAVAGFISTAAVADYDNRDFGEAVENRIHNHPHKLFGFKKPLAESASTTVDRAAGQPASDRQLLAKGLKATFVA